jgi:anaerobic selenocysteine-containing dehydrogenase
MLSTVRSEGQFNTIVYTDQDTYRRQSERLIVMMHPADMRAAGLREGQRVTLTSSAGRLSGLKVKPFDIRRGNLLMYFPEANVLVPLHTDPRSQTPGFKAVPVRLTVD